MSDLMGKRIVFIWLLLAFAWVAKSQNYMIKGIVTDSITGEPLPYVAVILKGTTIGATTDLDGAFTLSSSSKVRTLQVSYLGYTEKELKFVPGKAEHLKIQLAPTSINLSEVIIKPGKERYRKKDNPAVTFIKNAIARRESNDPRNHDYFRYDQYEKMVFAMNDYQPKPKKDGKAGKFDFLTEFIDTLEVGKTCRYPNVRKSRPFIIVKTRRRKRGSFWLRKRLVWMRSSHETVCNSS